LFPFILSTIVERNQETTRPRKIVQAWWYLNLWIKSPADLQGQTGAGDLNES